MFVGFISLTWVFSLMVPMTSIGHYIIEFLRGNPMIKTLESKVVKKLEDVPENKLCSVCMTDLVSGDTTEQRKCNMNTDRVVRLNCGHLYHFSCIQNWLSISQKCPYCRQPFSTEITPLLEQFRAAD